MRTVRQPVLKSDALQHLASTVGVRRELARTRSALFSLSSAADHGCADTVVLPFTGEIDVVEGVNGHGTNQMTLHTTAGASASLHLFSNSRLLTGSPNPQAAQWAADAR